MSTLRPNPNDIDYSRQNNRTALGICPLRKPKVQLLPLRYGLVERLDPAAALSLPYQTTSRPMGIRLVRDGWLYVIDNTSGYLHEYRVENGVTNWKTTSKPCKTTAMPRCKAKAWALAAFMI